MGTAAADKIFEEALSLPADERASLAERLTQSLSLDTRRLRLINFGQRKQSGFPKFRQARSNLSLVNRSSQRSERSISGEIHFSF